MDLSKAGLVKPASNYGATWADHPLDTGRARRVVQLAAEKSGWKSKLPRGRGRGIAVHRSFLSYVAMVVEVEVQPDGTVLVPRATVAVDAGFVANPDRARAQMEGALIMAMSNTLYSEITFADGTRDAEPTSATTASRDCAPRRVWSTCTSWRAKGFPAESASPVFRRRAPRSRTRSLRRPVCVSASCRSRSSSPGGRRERWATHECDFLQCGEFVLRRSW